MRNPNSLVKIEAFKPECHTIEECLIELEKYGYPHVTKSKGIENSYWWAGIDVFVTGEGVSFEVRCSNAKTPKEALNSVYGRLMEAMQKIKEK